MRDASDVEERCGAETRDGTPCEKYPAAGRSRCRFHGGASTGPNDPTALEGNDHAVGNDGGPPAGNTNALAHGATVPLDRLPERLPREQLHDTARWEYYAVLVSRERQPELGEDRRRRLAARWARLDVRRTTAAFDAWTDGPGGGRGFTVEREETIELGNGETLTVEREVANPNLGVESRTTAERRDVAGVLGLNDPDAPRADEAERRAAPNLPIDIGADSRGKADE